MTEQETQTEEENELIIYGPTEIAGDKYIDERIALIPGETITIDVGNEELIIKCVDERLKTAAV